MIFKNLDDGISTIFRIILSCCHIACILLCDVVMMLFQLNTQYYLIIFDLMCYDVVSIEYTVLFDNI